MQEPARRGGCFVTWSILGVPWHGAWHGWLVGRPWPQWVGSQASGFQGNKVASHRVPGFVLAPVSQTQGGA